MDNMIVINNLNFKYKNQVVFNNFCLSIKKGSFTTLIGNNGSGKSTLVKLLLGFENSYGSICIDDLLLCKDNIVKIRRNIGVVFDNPDSCLISDTVLDDLAFSLENLNFSSEFIYSKINEISNYLGISHLLNCNPHDLSGGEKQLVSLGCALVTGPKLIILDEALSMVDDGSKINILKILKKVNKDYGVTILNITHDIEESVYGSDIVVINDGEVIINDCKDKVYKQEKKLKKLGINLPFMVDLSNRLSYYDLIDEVLYDMDEMIDLLWK